MARRHGRISAALAVVLAAATVATVSGGTPDAAAQSASPEPTESSSPATAIPSPMATESASPGVTPSPSDSAANGSAPACATSVSDQRPIERLSGRDRYATAACTSQVGFPSGAKTVVLARGDDAGRWADALAGTVLADASDAPVLLTDPAILPAATRTEIARLGATEVLALGGPAAISESVLDALRGEKLAVRRISGADRAATAAAIAAEVGSPTSAIIVNGYRPADALVAGRVAATQGAALLLTAPGELPAATTAAIRAGVTDITVVGGFGVVDEATEARLRSLVGSDNLRRLGGAGRDETAATVARSYPAGPTVHLVSGADTSLVDAISASWLAAREDGGPVLYTDRAALSRGADRYLRLDGLAGVTGVRLVGGTAVVTDAVVPQIEGVMAEADSGGPAAQTRGMWVHLFDDSLKSRAGIEKVLDTATRANLNTVIVQSARRQDAYYDSEVIPRTPDPRMPADLDMLDRLIPAAHARGIEVEVWYSLMPAYHSAYAGLRLPDGLVWKEHGPGNTDYWVTILEDGVTASSYLDPAVPGVQEHVVSMLTDVVRNYDVDGVHLDYLRYDGARWGYHPIALERFREQTGRADRPAANDAQWGDWRREQTAELARRIYTEIAAVDPTVPVTMAAIAQGEGPSGADLDASYRSRRAYADKFQHWAGWVEGGFMDRAILMDYFDDSRYPSWFRQWSTFAKALGTRVPGSTAIGQASFLNTVGESLTQLDIGLADTNGGVLYSYQQDSASEPGGSLMAALGATRFATPAPPVAVPEKAAPTLGYALVAAPDGTEVTLTWESGGSGSPERAVTAIADANDAASFVKLPPGTWRVEAGTFSRTITIVAGEVARAEVS